MKTKSKDQLQQIFNRSNVKRQDLPQIPRSIQQYLQFMDYKIRKQFKSFTLLSLCGGSDRANFVIEKNFQKAFLAMNFQERVLFYAKYMDYIIKACEKLRKKQVDLNNVKTEHDSQQMGKVHQMPLKVSKGSNNLQQTTIIIQDFKAKSKDNAFNIELNNYLIRKSKKKSSCYVLQAIKPCKIQTVKFAFLSTYDQNKYLPIIQGQIGEGLYLGLLRQINQLYKRKGSQKIDSKQIKLKDAMHQIKNKVYQNKQMDLNQLLQAQEYGNEYENNQPQNKNRIKNNKKSQQNKFLNIQTNQLRNSRKADLNKSVIEDIVKSRDQQQLDQQLTQFINQQNQELQRRQRQEEQQQLQLRRKRSAQTPGFKKQNVSSKTKNYRNIFKIILPNYSLKQLTHLNHFGSVYQSNKGSFYVYVNIRDHTLFKMQATVQLPLQITCKAIYNVQLYKYWHPQIDQGQVKLKISSQNSCIIYQKTKAFSQWYKQRDYLLLTHMFRLNNAYYIVQKSVENSNFIPFQSITRGKFLYIVWKIQPQNKSKTNNTKCKVTVQLKANHQGLLNKNHQKQLTLRYIKGFQNMQQFYKNPQNQKKLSDLMGFQWTISDRDSYKPQNQDYNNNNGHMSLRTVDFQNVSQISQQQIYYSIQDLSQQQKDIIKQLEQQKSQHEITQPKAVVTNQMMLNSQLLGSNTSIQKIETNQQGIIILPKKYLKKRHIQKPFDVEKKLMHFQYDNIVEKDHWILQKSGGLKLINQQKIAAQNNVLKFIMKTLKKNLFSGKGILNISLPVEIFNVDSNLQRLCQALSLGPQFLQQVTSPDVNKLERFKRILGFGLSNSIIYFDVQKPFNPILGETYQGFIRGCPVYGEQISHHPPISSLYFIGRGYKITANLQAKVHVHMNSGDGINQGFYHILFDDGHQVIFQTPPAQISGLAMGDRRFNIKDRGLYLDQQNGYFCEMRMQATGGLFGKKKRQFVDQIQGQILKVKPQFIKKFLNAPIQKKPSPSKQEILQRLGQLSGRWPVNLKIDGKVYYDTHTDIPDQLMDDIYPLNSNSNYRQDLFYRKKNDLSRSQIQKQRLQVIQRGDRKLREKFHGKAQH